MEGEVEVVQLGDLEEDGVELLPRDHRLRRRQRHLHGLHVLQHDREALQVGGLAVHDAVQDALVHERPVGLGGRRARLGLGLLVEDLGRGGELLLVELLVALDGVQHVGRGRVGLLSPSSAGRGLRLQEVLDVDVVALLLLFLGEADPPLQAGALVRLRGGQGAAAGEA